jgi:hypothetical protein
MFQDCVYKNRPLEHLSWNYAIFTSAKMLTSLRNWCTKVVCLHWMLDHVIGQVDRHSVHATAPQVHSQVISSWIYGWHCGTRSPSNSLSTNCSVFITCQIIPMLAILTVLLNNKVKEKPNASCTTCIHLIEFPHKKKTNSMAFSPQANSTDWATITCWRNLVPTFADRGVSRGQCDGTPTVGNLSFVDWSRYISFK